jgi:hypothetical protein
VNQRISESTNGEAANGESTKGDSANKQIGALTKGDSLIRRFVHSLIRSPIR